MGGRAESAAREETGGGHGREGQTKLACQHNINIGTYYARSLSEQDYVLMLIIGVVFYLKQRDASYAASTYLSPNCILEGVTGNVLALSTII